MSKSNAQRQAEFRARHLKEEGGQGERLNMVVDLHAKAALDRLAACYGVTKRKALEMIIAGAERSMLDCLPMAQHDDYYSLRRNECELPGKTITSESIEAINKINSRGDLRSGLATTMLAIRDGVISPEDGNAISRAAAKRGKVLSQTPKS